MSEKKLLEIIPDAYDQIETIYKSEPFELTGFNDLDEMMYGFNGGIITIAARPAMGETSFLYSVMENILNKNKKTLLFTIERSKEQAVQHLLCMNAEIDSIHVRRGNMLEKDWENLAASIDRIADWELYINDTPMITTEEIEKSIQKNKPDFVCIDYLQLIHTKSKKDRNFQIEDIMQNLSKIAKENGVIIFLLSQLSRALEERTDKRPLLSDLRGSSAIESLSDVVMFIYRPEYYGHDEDAIIQEGETEIIVAKNKFGSVGTARLIFNYAFCKFFPAVRTTYEF